MDDASDIYGYTPARKPIPLDEDEIAYLTEVDEWEDGLRDEESPD